MPVEEVRKLINAIDDKKTKFNSSPFISKKLRELVGTSEPIELQQQIEDKLKRSHDELQQQIEDKLEQSKDELQNKLEQTKNELKQQMKDIQELLNSFIKSSNENNDIKENIDDKNNE